MDLEMRGRKGEVAKWLLAGLVMVGVVAIAAAAPGAVALLKGDPFGRSFSAKFQTPKERQKLRKTFYYLRKRGMIRTEYRGKQAYISLTREGKKLAKKYQIDSLQIKKPKKWDRRWRVLIFDIQEEARSKREALRGKLHNLGLFQLQKSVWVCPYEFQKEMDILREFFELGKGEMAVITASEIENDRKIRRFFKLQ